MPGNTAKIRRERGYERARYMGAVKLIDEMEKSGEYVKIVRCEQCKSLEMNANHYSLPSVHQLHLYWCHELDRDVSTIGYCGYGECVSSEEDK